MTNLITLTIPNDDHIALRAFGKALEEMALAHGAEPVEETLVRARVGEEEIEYLTRDAVAARLRVATEELQQAAPRMMQELRFEGEELQGKRKESEVDTTAQQFDETASFAEIAEAAPTTDSTGTPWDERIHSTSKALNADGTWRLRRKPKDMDEAEWAATVQKVQDELRFSADGLTISVASAPHDADPDTIPKDEFKEVTGFVEPPVTPPGDDFHTDAGVVTEQTVAGIPPIPVPPVATGAMLDALAEIPVAPPLPHTIPVPAAGEQAWDFPKLMKFLTEHHGKIDVPTVNQLLAVDGLVALTDLNAHPDKIGPFVARVKAHLGE